MSESSGNIAGKLGDLLAAAGLEPLQSGVSERFATYYELLVRWNARTNLSAIRDQDGILRRHFVESIACAQCLSPGIGTLVDFGSGAGFPGIPIALCRPEIAVTLAESQGKKAAFLREVVRTLRLPVTVHGGRAEALAAEGKTRQFDCVTLRAVDKMEVAVVEAARLVREGGWLVLVTSDDDMQALAAAAGADFQWNARLALPFTTNGCLLAGQRYMGSSSTPTPAQRSSI